MSVREYIGARYVPVFANPLQWDNEREYEPLTMVQTNGETYISRVYVPIGIDILNENYWVFLSNWNAQIAAYREEVQNYAEEVSGFDGRITDVENDVADVEYFTQPRNIGCLSTFRFGYRPPANFDVENMLDVAQNDFDVFSAHHWQYVPTMPDMRQKIPLFTESPYTVTTGIGIGTGEYCTCSGMVQDVLYKCGYRDIADEDGYMRTGFDFPTYLESKGWERFDNFNQAVTGSIIFQGARTDKNETTGVYENIPSHDFIYVSSSKAYDAGSTTNIQSGGQITYNINNYQNRGYDILTQLQWLATEPGFYTFFAPYPYNDVYEYTTNPYRADGKTLKEGLYCYQGFTVNDGIHIFQHFECQEGIVSQFGSIYDYTNFIFRLQPLSSAIPSEFYFDSTVTVPITATTAANAVPLSFNQHNESSDCYIDPNDPTLIRVKHRGLWMINVSLNFASSTSNTGIATILVYEGNSIIRFAHEPIDNASPFIDLTLLETVSPNDQPIKVLVMVGGATNPITIRSGRSQSLVSLTRLR